MNRKNLKFFIGGAAVLALVGYLAFTGFTKNAAYYLTVDEVLSRGDSIIDQNIRMEGLVQKGTIKWDSANIKLDFGVTHRDENDNPSYASMGSRINVVYNGIKPDSLIDGVTVIAEGKLVSLDTFHATNIMTKCPSKYEGKSVEDHKAAVVSLEEGA